MTEHIQTLPQAIQAEKTVLGTVLQKPDYLIDAIDALTPEHFHSPAHRVIWDLLVDMRRTGQAINMVSLQQRLMDAGKLDDVGGPAMVADMFSTGFDTAATLEHFESYITILCEKRCLRMILEATSSATVSCYEANPVSDITTALETFLADMRANHLRGERKELRAASDAVIEAIDAIEETMERASQSGLIGFASGFRNIDRLTAGFERKTLLLVGARPSVGKTSFGISLLHKFCVQDRLSCLYITLEGSRKQIIMRLASQVGNESVAKIKRGANPQKTMDALAVVSRAPLHVFRPTSMDMLAMEPHVSANAYDVVFIDYMQRLKFGEGNRASIREQMTDIASLAKDWSERYNCLVVGLAQLGRDAESGGEVREPGLRDFKESSGFEEAADYAILLHRPKARHGADENGNWIVVDDDCDLILAKNKDGAIGAIGCQFNRPLMRYEEIPEPEPEQTTGQLL